jgi:hypothetical protein
MRMIRINTYKRAYTDLLVALVYHPYDIGIIFQHKTRQACLPLALLPRDPSAFLKKRRRFA